MPKPSIGFGFLLAQGHVRPLTAMEHSEQSSSVLTHDSPAVAVLVTRDPAPSFDDALASLAAQDHPEFSILVIDDGSIEPVTERVAAIVPSAFVRRLDSPIGFGAAANLVRSMVAGAGFFIFCHDDVALAPDAVRLLVAESIRSGAALVGPKVVAWTNHDRLLGVGLNLDRAGNTVSLVDLDERDQGQHDVAREVVAVSGTTILVRSEAFVALDGFDPDATKPEPTKTGVSSDPLALGPDIGEDIDLCWRARIRGFSIVIEPSARVAHLGLIHGVSSIAAASAATALATSTDRVVDSPASPAIARRSLLFRERNRIRSMLITSSPIRLPFIVPVLLIQTLWRTLSPRHRDAGSIQGFGAWKGALQDTTALRARRSAVQAARTVSDRDDLRRLLPIGARARAAFRADVSADTARLWNLAERATASSQRARRVRLATMIVGAVVWLVGSRGLLGAGVPSVQQLSPLASSHELLKATVHTGAGGGSSAAAPALAFIGVLAMLLGGAHGMAEFLLTAGMLIVGALTIWRLTGHLLSISQTTMDRRDIRRRGGRRTSQGLVTAAYLATGLGVKSIAAGRLDASVSFGLFPLAILRLLRANERRTQEALTTGTWFAQLLRVAARIAPLGAVLAILFSFSPGSIVSFLIATAVLSFTEFGATVVSDSEPRSGKLLDRLGLARTAVSGAIAAGLLLLPWTVDLVRGGRSWTQFTGGDAARTASLRLSELLRLSTGLGHPSPLTWGLVGAAVVSLLIGSGNHLRIVLRGWALLLTSVVVVWLAGRGWLASVAPHPAVLLAPGAVGLALGAGLGAAVFAGDVRSQRFGWRQVLSVVGYLAFVVALIPMFGWAGTGRWGLPERSARSSLSWLGTLDSSSSPTFRTVWIGSPRVLPLAGFPVDRDLAIGVSTGGLPQVGDQWLARKSSNVGNIIDTVEHVRHGEISRAGTRLAVQGVRYVVVVSRAGPATARLGSTSDVTAAFVRQFDLRPIESERGVNVFENAAWTSSLLASPKAPAGTLALRTLQASLWLATGVALLRQRRRRRSHEALLLDQESAIDDDGDDRIGDLFSTSFAGDVDDEAAFAEFVAAHSTPAEPLRRRNSQREPVPRAEANNADTEPASKREPIDLPEEGSLADELWSEWSQRQSARVSRATNVKTKTGSERISNLRQRDRSRKDRNDSGDDR